MNKTLEWWLAAHPGDAMMRQISGYIVISLVAAVVVSFFRPGWHLAWVIPAVLLLRVIIGYLVLGRRSFYVDDQQP